MSESAAAAESPVTPSAQDQAVALLRGASADPPAAPSETPTTETPAAPPAPAPEPAPEAAPDDVAELISTLEARAAARAQKQQPDTAALLAKIESLEARLAQPPAPVHHDFAALVREHGHVKALEIVGLDPLEYFDKFKQVARDPAALDRARAQRAEADRLAKLEEQLGQQGKTLEQWQADQAAKAEAAQWNAYVSMAGTVDPILAKIPKQEIVERTQRKIAQLHEQYGAEAAAQVSDVQLAKLVAKDYRSLRDLLAGIDPGAVPTPQVPAIDGARQPATATLSNDLASQASGQTRPLNEEERVDAAIRLLKQAQG